MRIPAADPSFEGRPTMNLLRYLSTQRQNSNTDIPSDTTHFLSASRTDIRPTVTTFSHGQAVDDGLKQEQNFFGFRRQVAQRVAVTSLAIFSALGFVIAAPCVAGEPVEVIRLWPEGEEPGVTRVDPALGEQLVTSRRRTFNQYTNIVRPDLAVFPAAADKRTGAAVLVCPGGGMQRLAYEHEGLEIADWLNPLGISVFVLKYRVPGPSSTALLDAQRAMGIIRSRADEFEIDPNRIGAMGFSAGGELVLLLATNHSQRGYTTIDKADDFSCRPDHACLIYPGGIVSRRSSELRSDIAEKLDPKTTPNVFIVHAFSDSSLNSLELAVQLKQKNIPCEMHIYQEGGHGFGARDSALPLSGWKASYVQWIHAQGFFDAPFVSGYASQLGRDLRSPQSLTALTAEFPRALMIDAFAVQRQFVHHMNVEDDVIGFKAGPVIEDPTGGSGPKGPATGVLFRSGMTTVDKPLTLSAKELGPVLVETELGFVVSNGLDISTRIADTTQIKGAFESIVKVIELPVDLENRMQRKPSEIDLVAANIGSNRILVASQGISPDDFDANDFALSLTHNGELIHSVNGDPVDGGIWERMVIVVNRIVDQGYTLHAGDIVISGALGSVRIASPGDYVADYGEIGKIEFRID